MNTLMQVWEFIYTERPRLGATRCSVEWMHVAGLGKADAEYSAQRHCPMGWRVVGEPHLVSAMGFS
jgi:hypothetical protein